MTINETTSYAAKAIDNGKEDQEIWAVVKAWNQEFANNNPDAYFGYIHDRLTLFIASCPYRVNGKQDDRDEFEWSLKKGKTTVNFFQAIDPLVQVFGNIAVVTYYTRGSYGEGAADPMVYLKETDVLVKEKGKWQIVHIHVSK